MERANSFGKTDSAEIPQWVRIDQVNVMALNPQYEVIGKGFVQQYYALFDDPAQRPNLINMYNVSPDCSRLLVLSVSIVLNMTVRCCAYRPSRLS